MFLLKSKKGVKNSLYIHELSSFIYFASITFISLAILSYRSTDSSLLYYRSDGVIIANWCGWLGAHIAALVWFFLGAAALLCIPAGFFCCFLYWKSINWREYWERLLGLAIVIISSATLLCLHDIHLWSTVPGGFIGQLFAYHSNKLLGDFVGAFFTWYILLTVALILVTRLSIFNGLLFIVRGLNYFFASGMAQQVSRRIIAWACYLFAQIHRLLNNGGNFFWSVLNGSIFENTGLIIPASHEDACCTQSHVVPDFSDILPGFVRSYSSTASEPADRAATFSENSNMVNAVNSKKNIEESNSKENQKDNFLTFAQPSHHNNSDSVNVSQDMNGSKDKIVNLEKITNNSADYKEYKLPDSSMLIPAVTDRTDSAKKKELEARAKTLEEKLERFGVFGSVVGIKAGPVVTLFEYEPAIDTKLSKIVALEDDLALALQALSIRILAPIPGRSVVGFEVANNDRKDVLFTSIFSSTIYQKGSARLPLILGEDTVGGNVVADLTRMPHLLIAGSTGSGKSVALNAMLMSLLGKLSPAQMKLILIDPKRLEFAPYADIPHLLFPIVTQVQQVPSILRWVVQQMEERYEIMATVGVRNISDYLSSPQAAFQPMPYIVLIIDELADLMMTVGRDVEDLITRITQMARAAGIHMMVATQRPSVDVITGLIKVNFPSRISFRVTSKVDSRTILDCGGAEKLLGRGDMLFLDSTVANLRRVHGAYISDAEITRVVSHLRSQQPVAYLNLQEELAALSPQSLEEQDSLYQQVIEFVRTQEDVSISLLQRKFRIGYNRAARIIDQLAAQGMILPAENGKTRKVVK